MSDLGTVERAWADGYAAAQHEISRLRAALAEANSATAAFASAMQLAISAALANEQKP